VSIKYEINKWGKSKITPLEHKEGVLAFLEAMTEPAVENQP
jgi:hypothetical protein